VAVSGKTIVIASTYSTVTGQVVATATNRLIRGSFDGGKTWSTLEDLKTDPTQVGNIGFTNLNITPTGKLLVASEYDFKDGTYGVFHESSSDQGKTWNLDGFQQDFNLNRFLGVSLTPDGGMLSAIQLRAGSGSETLIVGSKDDGANFL